jgi:hypothetical protein
MRTEDDFKEIEAWLQGAIVGHVRSLQMLERLKLDKHLADRDELGLSSPRKTS